MSLISLHDKQAIADFAAHNPFYHLYEIGDLDDFFWPHVIWYGWQEQDLLRQIALLYIAQPTLPTLLANPEPPLDTMRAMLSTLLPLLPRRLYAHLHPDMVDLFSAHYAIEPHGLHYKMGLTDMAKLSQHDGSEVVALTEADLPAIDQLYKAAYPGNWFDARNLQSNAYVGIRSGNALISIAGIHVYSPHYQVAALGNVTTLPSERGKGLAQRTCAKLCQTLLARGINKIGLNVKADNAAALHSYAKLGFTKAAEYGEYLLDNPR